MFMNKIILIAMLMLYSYQSFSQKTLISWGQGFIENYNKEMYADAQKLTSSELLSKNLKDTTWADVFLTLNASINNYKNDINYLKELANQIPNNEVVLLKGTSRLIIWERIISGDIIFEGKGLVIDNDLYQVGGRANQILQSLTNKNFGFVTIRSTKRDLHNLKNKWLTFLANKPVDEYKPVEYPNAANPEVASLVAVQALILSLQESPQKTRLTKQCLKRLYNLDEMPEEIGSPASYCSPDTYTYSYLGGLFGDQKFDPSKDAKWWQTFWEANHTKLFWNAAQGFYELAE
jgi:hypothetical protein